MAEWQTLGICGECAMIQDDWHSCYKDSWQGIIVREAFVHPAKFARGLIYRIYKHCIDEGWLKAGDIVIDPFAGVSLGALDGMRIGIQFIGIELEPRFINLGKQNINLWSKEICTCSARQPNQKSSVMDHQPTYETSPSTWNPKTLCFKCGKPIVPLPYLIQGDSRRLSEIVGMADACVASPPYASSDPSGSHVQGHSRLDPKSSNYRPFAVKSIESGYNKPRDYGSHPFNLGNLPATEKGFDAAISSPQYPTDQPCASQSRAKQDYYGFTRRDGTKRDHSMRSEDNLGLQDDFWSAARQIVEQLYLVLKPGGHAIWILKDFVRDKKIVPFCDQWRQMCEAVDFESLHWHKTWLVEKKGMQMTLHGEDQIIQTERKSFFRRLAERKGSPRIDYEVVLCMEKGGKNEV